MMINPHALAVLLLTLFALILFTRERIPLQTSSLVVLCLLTGGFALYPYQLADGSYLNPESFFYGFGHEALVAVCALMIIGAALVKTGALEPIGNLLARSWRTSPHLSFLATLILTGILSAFINNTPIVVLLIPILVSVALKTKSSPSTLLMPMGFASLLGGMSTTIGTSTNLLVVSVAGQQGLGRIGMFDFFLPAAIVGLVGIAFLWVFAPLILPRRDIPMGDSSSRVFTAHLVIPEGSWAVGKSVADLAEATDGRLAIDKIRRSSTALILPLPDAVVREGDRLLVHDTPENLKFFENAIDATLYAGSHRVDESNPLESNDQRVIEIIVDQRSPLLGRTLQSTHFIETYNMVALAVHRGGEQIREMPKGLGNFRLRHGDILLAQGTHKHIAALKSRHEFMVLDTRIEIPRSRKAPLALLVMALVVLTAASGLMPISISATLGVLALLVCGCLNWHDVSRALNVSVVMIVVSSLALGQAMTATGASDFLAQSFVGLVGGAPAAVVLSGLILLMAIFTNVVSNNAAAVIGTPIAIKIATSLQLDPEPFVLGVLFGVNMSFATPMAYKTNLLIMSAGNYTFGDFVRLGVPLTLLMWLGFSLVLSLLYSLW
ncbi:MAG TPA: SLC13 family permease [Thiolinea sp.]|nr:SLC13 family permease [Thiolinea sp.]